MKLNLDKNLRPDLSAKVAALINQHKWIIPTWLHTLSVSIGHGETDIVAKCHVDHEYRQATIQIFDRFATENNEFQESTIIHELIHIHTSPIIDYVKTTLDETIKDDTQRNLITQQLDRLHEGITCDLEYAIGRKI